MKYTLLSFFTLLILAISFYPQKELISKENGSPGAQTNSLIDGQNCTSCHAGSINSGSGTTSITTNIPSGGYVPGNIYTITTTVDQTGINKFGFELTAEDLSVKQGTFFITNSTETKFANGTSNTGVTHKLAGTSGTNTKSWDCDWEAPVSGTGDITFYAAALAANANGNNNGDDIYTNAIIITEAIYGCTNPTALNYDPTATVDDGSCTYQMTYVPDDNFENHLEANGMGDGIALNDSVLTANINIVIFLNVSSKNIADLTGVEDFTALTVLNCGSNQLTSLDVSNNISLTDLWCQINQLTSLDVSQNTALTILHCGDELGGNQLTSLDVSQNTVLTNLSCGDNQLTSLDISNNTALIDLHCGSNPLTTLDVSNNTALTGLTCYTNQLTILDLSNNTALMFLDCSSNSLTSLDVSNNTALFGLRFGWNQITSLDVSNNTALDGLLCHDNQLTSLDVSQNTELTMLYCFDNQLTSLDVSANVFLTELSCYDNQLTSLDVRNGNNAILAFGASNNPNLFCIDVDDPVYSTANWTLIDAWASFSSNCNPIYGCTDATATNYDPLATVDDFSCCYLTVSDSVTDVSCYGANNGSIIAIPSAGVPPFQYSLGGGLSQVSGTFTGLTAGSYYIDVTDINGCTSNQTVIITQPTLLSISINATDETAALNDGSATAIVMGGTLPYAYTWSNSGTTNSQVNLAPGVYNVTITDANGCLVSTSVTVNAYTPTGIININNTSKTLIKITDVLGQETPYRKNTLLFYIYDDGTVEQKIFRP